MLFKINYFGEKGVDNQDCLEIVRRMFHGKIFTLFAMDIVAFSKCLECFTCSLDFPRL